jgi:hypothetical protein
MVISERTLSYWLIIIIIIKIIYGRNMLPEDIKQLIPDEWADKERN